MLTQSDNKGPNNGACAACIHFNLFEIELPEGGKIGEFRCTTSHCNNGSKFKLRTPESEMEVHEKHDHW